ncbi:MAG: NAD(P)H-quinone oxidoreductase [Thermoleophilia bacterium]|nr:NAD(P)H-quinone oxidoreductase [Thermoleophilia bacterium]
MHAVVIDAGKLHWRERPDPCAGDHEIVVAVRAAGVNGADLAQREGRYPAPPGWPPDIPGLEMAGEVVSTGEAVTRFAPGDRVMGLVGGGGQATLAAVDEAHALAVPDGVSWPEAGGFMEVCATAFDALFGQARLTVGERVLVTGAAGGVGCVAVQLAALAGARVTASVRDRALHDAVAELGAAEVIEPEAVTDGGPYDVVLELVGAASLPCALRALATRGRVVVIGVGSGARLEVDLLSLMTRRARVFASTLRGRSRAEKASLIAALGARVVPALAEGRLRVPVTGTFPLRDAGSAYERFAAGGKLGKIVLVA